MGLLVQIAKKWAQNAKARPFFHVTKQFWPAATSKILSDAIVL